MFTEIEAVDVLRMVYFVIFLLLVGMMIWYVVLRRGKPDEDTQRRNWIIADTAITSIVLIAVVAEFVQHAVGFEDWERVQNMLLHTTAGNPMVCISCC